MNEKQFAIDKKSIEQYKKYNEHMTKIASENIRNHNKPWQHREWEDKPKEWQYKTTKKPKPKWTAEDQRIEDELWDT